MYIRYSYRLLNSDIVIHLYLFKGTVACISQFSDIVISLAKY